MHWILRVILHVFFWCTYCLFAGLISFKLHEGFDFIFDHLLVFSLNALWAVAIFYLHYILIFKIASRRQFFKYLSFSVAATFVVSAFFFSIFWFFILPEDTKFQGVMFFPSVIGSFIIGNCGSLLKGFISWFSETERKAELEKQSLKVELEMLRSQLNHHFLFNTLNNIDALIFKNPQKASDALISLSSILRYMLYDTNNEKVTLKNEIHNIENIIQLEQLRVTTPGYTQIEIEGSVSSALVPPLLFVSFVENAYKHSKYLGKLPVIDINFKILEKRLLFTCVNSKEHQAVISGKPGNLGLLNIRRRLELIYGEKCKLEVTSSDSEFKIYLEIPY
jgi:sensor histidine kinase YesM